MIFRLILDGINLYTVMNFLFKIQIILHVTTFYFFCFPMMVPVLILL